MTQSIVVSHETVASSGTATTGLISYHVHDNSNWSLANFAGTAVVRRSPFGTSSTASAWGQTVSREAAINERRYEALFAAVAAMGDAEFEVSDHVDYEAVADATDFLVYLQAFEVPPPKVFSHGGDTIAFTWDGPRRYVTPVEGVGVLYEPSTVNDDGFERSYDLTNSHELARLMKVLGGRV
ncbi:hypothetical protein AAII07_22655 [Microvirga sp. 0TCS3.31]